MVQEIAQAICTQRKKVQAPKNKLFTKGRLLRAVYAHWR